MPKFEIAFVDGKKIVKEASTADEAKAQAKHERRAPLPRDTPGSAPEVKVTSVTRLQDESRDRSDSRNRDDRDRDRDRNAGPTGPAGPEGRQGPSGDRDNRE